jgi:hypothetical protein
MSQSIVSVLSFDNDGIRTTASGQVSVFDFIRIVGGQKGERKVWERLCVTYPEVVPMCHNFKFPGKGQRNTPVAGKKAILEILNLLPGVVGKAYRQEAAKIVLAFLDAPAELAITAIDRVQDPIDLKRIEVRAKAKVSNLGLNSAIKSCGGEKVYPVVADMNNIAVTGQCAKDLKLTRNVKQTRDGMSALELSMIEAAEQLETATLKSNKPSGDKAIASLCREVASDIATLMRKYNSSPQLAS